MFKENIDLHNLNLINILITGVYETKSMKDAQIVTFKRSKLLTN